jgi:Mrp family chromosome partitioning ATPase
MLGQIPKARLEEKTALNSPRAMPSAPYDVVAVNIRNFLDRGVLLLTSPRGGDGKTVSALNIAAALVREGRRVVLVDGDARKGGLSELLEVDPEHPGLTDLARGATSDDCRLELDFAGGRLLFVPSGPSSPDLGPLYRSAALRDAIGGLRGLGDTVIIDAPPVLIGSDAASLADSATSVLMVVKRRTPTGLLERACQGLAIVRAPIIGYLFTQNRGRRTEYNGGRVARYEDEDLPGTRQGTAVGRDGWHSGRGVRDHDRSRLKRVGSLRR